MSTLDNYEIESVTTYIQGGGDPNALVGNGKQTLLAECVSRRLEASVRFLLEGGANPNIQDRNGWIPLHIASSDDQWNHILGMLLNHDHDSNARTGSGKSPLVIASWGGAIYNARLLLEYGADPDLRTSEDESALGGACQWGHCEVVKALVFGGADVKLQSGGKAPISYSWSAQEWETTLFLLHEYAKKPLSTEDRETLHKLMVAFSAPKSVRDFVRKDLAVP